MPASSVASVDFWTFAKYPPDLPFLPGRSHASSVAGRAAIIAGACSGCCPFVVFGRVPSSLRRALRTGIAQAVLRTKVDLPETYLIWLLLLLAMAWPCAWYYEKKRYRPNLVTRYF
jgi:hypothetical protein